MSQRLWPQNNPENWRFEKARGDDQEIWLGNRKLFWQQSPESKLAAAAAPPILTEFTNKLLVGKLQTKPRLQLCMCVCPKPNNTKYVKNIVDPPSEPIIRKRAIFRQRRKLTGCDRRGIGGWLKSESERCLRELPSLSRAGGWRVEEEVVGRGGRALLLTFSPGATPPPSSSPCDDIPQTQCSASPRRKGRQKAARAKMVVLLKVLVVEGTQRLLNSSVDLAAVCQKAGRQALVVISGEALPGLSWGMWTRVARWGGKTKQVTPKKTRSYKWGINPKQEMQGLVLTQNMPTYDTEITNTLTGGGWGGGSS